MFEDSLLESGGRLKTKRGRTTTLAIVIEIGLIGIMVLMPLIFTEALPKTPSGKIMRRLLVELSTTGSVRGDVTGLEDITTVDHVRDAVRND